MADDSENMTSNNFVVTDIPEHLKMLSENLYHLQQEGLYCDVLLMGKDGNVKCHSVILAATSCYFKQFISNSEKNMNDPASLSSIYLKGNLVEDLQNLVKLLYTGSLMLSTLNINRIIKLLHFVDMATVVNYLQQHVIPHNKTFEELYHTGSKIEKNFIDNLSLSQDFDQWCNDEIRNDSINDEARDSVDERYNIINRGNEGSNKSSNNLSNISRKIEDLCSSSLISTEKRYVYTPKDRVCEFDNVVHSQFSTTLTLNVNSFYPNVSNSGILNEDPDSSHENGLTNDNKTRPTDVNKKLNYDEDNAIVQKERNRDKNEQQNHVDLNNEIGTGTSSTGKWIYQETKTCETTTVNDYLKQKRRTNQKEKPSTPKKTYKRPKIRKNDDNDDDGNDDNDDSDDYVYNDDGGNGDGGDAECSIEREIKIDNKNLLEIVKMDSKTNENHERNIKPPKNIKINLRRKIVSNLEKEKKILRYRKKITTKEKICRLCNVTLENKEAYMRHRKEIHMNKNNKIMYWVDCKKFKCDYEGCDYKSKFRGYVVRHKDLEHGETIDEAKTTVFRCQAEGCTYYHVQKSKLKAHMMDKHSSERMYTCEVCDKKFKRQSALNKHKQAHIPIDKRNNAFTCEQCNKKFATKGEMQQHVRRCHDQDVSYEKKQFLCHKCPYSSKDKSRIHLHLFKIHNIPLPNNTQIYRCTVCDYYTFYKPVFESHLSKHAGESFICDTCGKVFGSHMNLAAHKNRHNNENKKLRCSYEGCTYIGPRDGMKRHIDRMHIFKNTKPFVCHLCDYRTNVQWSLTIHLRGKHKMEVETKSTLWKKLMETGQGYNEIFIKDCKTLSENIKFDHLQ